MNREKTIIEICQYCDSLEPSDLKHLTDDQVNSIDATDLNWCYNDDGSEHGETAANVSTSLYAAFEQIQHEIWQQS